MPLSTGGLKGQIPYKLSDSDDDWGFKDAPTITTYFDNTKGFDYIPVGAGNSGIGTENWRSAYTVFVPNVKAGDFALLLGEGQVRNDLVYNVEFAQCLTFIDANDVDPQGTNNGQTDGIYNSYVNLLPENYDSLGNKINTSPNFYHVNGHNISPANHYGKATKVAAHRFKEDHPNGIYFYMRFRCNSQGAQSGHACWLSDQGFLQVNLFRGFDSLPDIPPDPPEEITWSDSYEVNNTLDAGNLINMGLRVVIPSRNLSASGNKVRLTLQAPTVSGNATHVVSCYIAEKTGTYAPTGTIKQVTFGGNAGFTLNYGDPDLVSDVIDFAIDKNKDYVLFFGCASANGYCARTEAPNTNAYWKANANGDGLNTSPSGYTHDGACGEYIIKKIEVSI